MNKYWKNRQAGWNRQKGMTLMELLVAGFISIIVSSGMVVLMASTLGTGTQTIKMTQLSGELRSAMQIMSRELRRANYHTTYTACFGDLDCLATLGVDSEVAEININADEDCVWFWYDRPQRCESPPCTSIQLSDDQDAITDETVAAFRRMENADGAGIIQMAVTADTTISCGDDLTDTDWADITNPELVDVEVFNVDDAVTGFESYVYTVNGTQGIERIGITITGRLLTSDASLPTWMQDNSALPLTIRDFVRVRNDIPGL